MDYKSKYEEQLKFFADQKTPTTVNIPLILKATIEKHKFNLSEWIRETLTEEVITAFVSTGKFKKNRD